MEVIKPKAKRRNKIYYIGNLGGGECIYLKENDSWKKIMATDEVILIRNGFGITRNFKYVFFRRIKKKDALAKLALLRLRQ